MTALKVLRAIALALMLAVLLAVIGAIVAEQDYEGTVSTVFFVAGLVGFSVLFLKVDHVGFWFCLSCAIEWALLPVAAAINTTQSVRETGCAGAVAALGVAVVLGITVPVGAAGFIVFLLLALLVFKRKKARPGRPANGGTEQP